MNANETTRELNPTELEQVAGGGAGTFVPNSTFSTSGSTVLLLLGHPHCLEYPERSV